MIWLVSHLYTSSDKMSNDIHLLVTAKNANWRE